MTEPGPSVIFLDMPELARPSDPLPDGIRISVASEAVGTDEFTSLAALIARRDQVEAEKASRVLPWQAAIAAPAWVLRDVPQLALTVYGYLLDDTEIAKIERRAGATLAGVHDLLERVHDAAGRGWLYGRWFSHVEPAGEWGCTHRSDLTELLDVTAADAARSAGWPVR